MKSGFRTDYAISYQRSAQKPLVGGGGVSEPWGRWGWVREERERGGIRGNYLEAGLQTDRTPAAPSWGTPGDSGGGGRGRGEGMPQSLPFTAALLSKGTTLSLAPGPFPGGGCRSLPTLQKPSPELMILASCHLVSNLLFLGGLYHTITGWEAPQNLRDSSTGTC